MQWHDTGPHSSRKRQDDEADGQQKIYWYMNHKQMYEDIVWGHNPVLLSLIHQLRLSLCIWVPCWFAQGVSLGHEDIENELRRAVAAKAIKTQHDNALPRQEDDNLNTTNTDEYVRHT